MQRQVLHIEGIVQGVGFRPFVFNLASRCGLSGFTKNSGGTVWIEVEGPSPSLELFVQELCAAPPFLAHIDAIRRHSCPSTGERGFRIEPSTSAGRSANFLPADSATCDECLSELFDPANRRYRHPFINCIHCGPRFTIVTTLPYDRSNTSMAEFSMCEECRAEYENPADRRFHAQPIACPRCGPKLEIWNAYGAAIAVDDPVSYAAMELSKGRIVAMKGIGGYHLVCNAHDASAVGRLRHGKQRAEKPFAVMVADVPAAEQLCRVSSTERMLLLSPTRPVVLLEKRADSEGAKNLPDGLAPGQRRLGIFLPYTPLHHLLMRAVSGLPLVMTSGNRSDKPIVYEDQEALRRLGPNVDFFLTHNRPIRMRCDDSVVRANGQSTVVLRRSRGYAPLPVQLPHACARPMLAVGGQLKSAFALGRERHAFISHHLGDLDGYESFCAFAQSVEHYERLFAIQPQRLVCDLHPDYTSTQYARECERKTGVPCLAVQHHHAHMAGAMAENGLSGRSIGVMFDGTGAGTDGAVWGGEFLVGDCRAVQRAAHLRYAPLPGGEQAIREPWRIALSHLLESRCDPHAILKHVSASGINAVAEIAAKKINSPLTSSCGRLFDAVAAIIGLRGKVSYEGQAAIELEALASQCESDRVYGFGLQTDSEPLVIDTRPLISEIVEELAQGTAKASIARSFHNTLVAIVEKVCLRLRETSGLNDVVLSGGVFANSILAEGIPLKLERAGFKVYSHHRVPPNDGGLSFGQLAVAAACDAGESSK